MTEFPLLDTVARLLYKDGVTLDIAAWPVHKNDSQDLRCVVFFFERYGSVACTRMTRTNSGRFFFSCEVLMAPCSRMTRTNRVAGNLNVKKAWPVRKDDNS